LNFTQHVQRVISRPTSARLEGLWDLSATEMRHLVELAGVEAVGRAARVLDPELGTRLRATHEADQGDFDRALATTLPAHLCFEALTRLRSCLDAVLRARRASVDFVLVSASELIQRAHSAVHQLLTPDASTRMLLGEQRKQLNGIATLLAAAHGELWMSGGTEDGARKHLAAAFDATTSLIQTRDVPRQALEVLASVLEEISEAGRLLYVDFTI
jgi:hypothetical protein